MTAERSIYLPLGDLVALAKEVVAKPGGIVSDQEDRLNVIVAELVAICTAKPSRKPFVDSAKIIAICLRKLFLAQRSGQPDRVFNFESSLGFFLPFLRRDELEAVFWEREQEKS